MLCFRFETCLTIYYNIFSRRLPGSPISVCARDRVVVDLVNKLPSTTTSIHWHGLYMHGGPLPGKERMVVNMVPSTITTITPITTITTTTATTITIITTNR